MALFESYERREKQILAVIKQYGINSIEECADVCKAKGLDIYKLVEGIQPICFENAKWAYTVGCAIAIKKGCTKAADAAAAIGEGLQAFCIPGSVADQRKVGLGHGNLGKMLLEEDTECFAFLAGHESFAAAEGAIGIAEKANKVRQKPLRVILNGLGKDAAQIIARINGFTYVETEMDYHTGDIIKVTVTSIENYGIFVTVDEEYNGMIHISEMSDSFVSNVRNYAFPGETIYAKVMEVDQKKYQIKLSIKSIDYRLTSQKGSLMESPNGFSKLKEKLPIWIDAKLKEIECNG